MVGIHPVPRLSVSQIGLVYLISADAHKLGPLLVQWSAGPRDRPVGPVGEGPGLHGEAGRQHLEVRTGVGRFEGRVSLPRGTVGRCNRDDRSLMTDLGASRSS